MPASGTRWLSTQEQRDWRAYLEGSMHLAAALEADLTKGGAGVSLSEYEVLVRLSEAPNRAVRMSVLADSLGHSRSRITHTVQRLAGRGLVERTTCQTDGRGVVCVMTSKGWELLVAAAPIHVESVRARIIDVLTAEELSALAVAMGKIAANVASCADHGGANAKLEA